MDIYVLGSRMDFEAKSGVCGKGIKFNVILYEEISTLRRKPFWRCASDEE